MKDALKELIEQLDTHEKLTPRGRRMVAGVKALLKGPVDKDSVSTSTMRDIVKSVPEPPVPPKSATPPPAERAKKRSTKTATRRRKGSK
jgi:hypothetical protein